MASFILHREKHELTKPSEAQGSGPIPKWSLELYQQYITWIKNNFEPRMTQEAEQVLTSYYQRQRARQDINGQKITIRFLESLIRLAQSHARLMARNEVLLCDSIVVIALMERSAQR